jgi:hypothetical protein
MKTIEFRVIFIILNACGEFLNVKNVERGCSTTTGSKAAIGPTKLAAVVKTF